jgi:hypothetical protein
MSSSSSWSDIAGAAAWPLLLLLGLPFCVILAPKACPGVDWAFDLLGSGAPALAAAAAAGVVASGLLGCWLYSPLALFVLLLCDICTDICLEGGL